jgi:hypothetical protein
MFAPSPPSRRRLRLTVAELVDIVSGRETWRATR